MKSPFLSIQRRKRFAAPGASPAATASPRFAAELPELVSVQADARTVLAVGSGAAGSDVGANSDGRLIDMTGLDRFLHFDPAAGRLRAQAGVTIGACLQFLAERGHFLPVTPAWSATTLAAAAACDVHGPNHEANGAFGGWVRRLRLHRTDRPALDLAPGDSTGLFEATIGGLGLTGVIEWVEVETRPIRSSMMVWEAESFDSVEDLFALVRESQDWVYRRAWLDPARVGHGRMERFRHAQDGPMEARVPQPLLQARRPVGRWLANGFTASLVAGVWGRRGPASRRRDYASVFFPIEDAINGFDNMFGRRGCVQYQAVLPWTGGEDALRAWLKETKRLDDGLVLIGLTPFGARASAGLISFPRDGLCVTVRTRAVGERVNTAFANLDAIVRDAGGRINPSADVRAPRAMLQQGYPNLGAFGALIDPAVRSDFMRRMAAA